MFKTTQNHYNNKPIIPPKVRINKKTHIKEYSSYGVRKKQNQLEEIIGFSINCKNQILNTKKDQAVGVNKKVTKMQNKETNSSKAIVKNGYKKQNYEVNDSLLDPSINVESLVSNTISDQQGANKKLVRNAITLITIRDENIDKYDKGTDDSSIYLSMNLDVEDKEDKLRNNDIPNAINLSELNQAVEKTTTEEMNNSNLFNNETKYNNSSVTIKNTQSNISLKTIMDNKLKSKDENDHTNLNNKVILLKLGVKTERVHSCNEVEIYNIDKTSNNNNKSNDNTKIENQKAIPISNDSNVLVIEKTKKLLL